MSEKREQESNTGQASRSKDQIPPSPERSASIHRHPNILRGLQERLSRIKGQLVSDHARGILAVEEIIASLHNSGQEPFPGFTENMTAEFASLREDMGNSIPISSAMLSDLWRSQSESIFCHERSRSWPDIRCSWPKPTRLSRLQALAMPIPRFPPAAQPVERWITRSPSSA